MKMQNGYKGTRPPTYNELTSEATIEEAFSVLQPYMKYSQPSFICIILLVQNISNHNYTEKVCQAKALPFMQTCTHMLPSVSAFA